MGEDLREQVKSRYARAALAVLGTGEGGEASRCEPASCCGGFPGSSCDAHVPEVDSADLTGGSYSAEELEDLPEAATFEHVITVYDAPNEACPVFPDAKNHPHWCFDDPSQATGTEEERLKLFRRVRDEIRARIEGELVPEEGWDVSCG